MELWKGIEREGEYKGTKTLFVGSPKITFGEIKTALRDYPDISQIYFGAGCCTPINNNVIYDCYKYFTKYIITAEISIDDFIEKDVNWLKQINVIITFVDDKVNLFKQLRNVQIKLQAPVPNTLYVQNLNEFIHTDCKDLEGKKYKKDVVIK